MKTAARFRQSLAAIVEQFNNDYLQLQLLQKVASVRCHLVSFSVIANNRRVLFGEFPVELDRSARRPRRDVPFSKNSSIDAASVSKESRIVCTVGPRLWMDVTKERKRWVRETETQRHWQGRNPGEPNLHVIKLLTF